MSGELCEECGFQTNIVDYIPGSECVCDLKGEEE